MCKLRDHQQVLRQLQRTGLYSARARITADARVYDCGAGAGFPSDAATALGLSAGSLVIWTLASMFIVSSWKVENAAQVRRPRSVLAPVGRTRGYTRTRHNAALLDTHYADTSARSAL